MLKVLVSLLHQQRKVGFILAFSFIVMICGVAQGDYNTKSTKGLLANETPKELAGLEVQENLGGMIDLSLEFVDDSGKQVQLGDYFNDGRPVLMSVVYYSCPSLCNYHLNGLLDVFRKMKWKAGKDFRLLTVSMNPRETSEVAHKKKLSYLKEYGQDNVDKGWNFLTGSEENIKKITSQLGFRFRWDEKVKQYAHPAVAYVMTPRGKISRYLYGIEFSPRTLRLSLVEAAKNKVGNVVDRLLLFCFQFNPQKSKYTIAAFNLMRLAAAVMVLVVALLIVPIWIRERRKKLKGA